MSKCLYLPVCANPPIRSLNYWGIKTYIFQYALIHQSEASTTRGIKTFIFRYALTHQSEARFSRGIKTFIFQYALIHQSEARFSMGIKTFIFQYVLIHQSETWTTRGIKTYIMLRPMFYIPLPLFLLHSAYCEMSFCHAPYTRIRAVKKLHSKLCACECRSSWKNVLIF